MPAFLPLAGGALGEIGESASATTAAVARRGPNLLLSEPLPLRTTRMLGDYSDDVALPHVIGDFSRTQFPLRRLSDTRFFAADHVAEIDDVYIAKQLTQGWERRLESDTAGRTWTVVEFASPVTAGEPVSATGRGVRDPVTGELIENPADALAYIGNTLAGRVDDWSDFRAECSRAGLTVATWIGEATSIKAALDSVAQSVGAIWTPGVARLYPSSETPRPILDLTFEEVEELAVEATLADTADVLRLAYDWSPAAQRHLQYVELEANPARYGGIAVEVSYPNLRNAADAEAVGRPVLQRLAGERWTVAFVTSNTAVRAGMWVRLVDNPASPLPGGDPLVMVLTPTIDPASSSVRVQGEVLVTTPAIAVTAHSVALPDSIEAGIDVSFRDGVATFTILDDNDRPLAGARVALDSGAPQSTDAQGHVSFTTTAGVHQLAVEATGYVPFTVFVTV